MRGTRGRGVSACAVFAVALLFASSAAAQISFTPFDLADSSVGPITGLPEALDVPIELSYATGGVPVAQGECVVSFAGEYIVPSSGGIEACPGLWKNRDLSPMQLYVEHEGTVYQPLLEPAIVAGGAGAVYQTSTRTLVVDATSVALPTPDGAWTTLSTSGGGVVVPADLGQALQNGAITRIYAPDPSAPGSALALRVSTTKGGGTMSATTGGGDEGDAGNGGGSGGGGGGDVTIDASTAGGEQSGQQAVGVVGSPLSAKVQCPDPPTGDEYLICVDATSGIDFIMFPETHVLKPNHSIRVVVFHSSLNTIDVELTGRPGLEAPKVDKGVTRGADELPPIKETLEKHEESFAPRTSGTPVYLTVNVYDLEGRLVGQDELELVVAQTYAGAFRFGLAGVFFGGLEGDYKRRKQPGSEQHQLISGSDNAFDIEMVLAYAPFLESGGRTVQGCAWRPFCFAPYVGVGVIAQDANGDVDFLKSFHLGVEWEPVRGFAIAVTGVARRVERLQDGARIGMAVEPSGDLPTTETIGVGMGVSVNFTPDFMRLVRDTTDSL